MTEAQPFSVKRAQVEFHNFASLGEPERNLRIYAEENTRRGTVIRHHLEFIGAHDAVPRNRRQRRPLQLHAGERIRRRWASRWIFRPILCATAAR